MKVTYPISISDQLVGTLKITISVQRETAVQAYRIGIDAEELQNLVLQKLAEVQEFLGEWLEGEK